MLHRFYRLFIIVLSSLALSLIPCFVFAGHRDSQYRLSRRHDKFVSVSNTTTTRRAAFWALFNLTPGGGETYFLTAALAIQQLGYEIDIVIFDDNACGTHECISGTLVSLRIPLQRFRVVVLTFGVDWYRELWMKNKEVLNQQYDILFTMGNMRWSNIPPIGRTFNIFMCQFPFDELNRDRKSQAYLLYGPPSLFPHYDLVLVNSKYTFFWYIKSIFTSPGVIDAALVESTLLIPNVSVVYPPVISLKGRAVAKRDGTQFSADVRHVLEINSQTVNIAVMGRFFRGAQSKGHDLAIEIFKKVISSTNKPLHLYLMGYIHANAESLAYVEELKANISSLPITILTNLKVDEVPLIMSKMKIFWHLTGARYLGSSGFVDPGQFEHFGIAIVEAMSVGCIPICTKIGGPSEIVSHRVDGYLAESIYDYSSYTLEILNSPSLDHMVAAAQHKISSFTRSLFIEKIQDIVGKGIETKKESKINVRRNTTSTFTASFSFL
jgi:glycosyltransferase involved in cell wall biosynthesis